LLNSFSSPSNTLPTHRKEICLGEIETAEAPLADEEQALVQMLREGVKLDYSFEDEDIIGVYDRSCFDVDREG
jgi:hypothetical protein